MGTWRCPGRNGLSAIHFREIFASTLCDARFTKRMTCINDTQRFSWYTWSTVLVFGIHAPQYLCLASTTQNIYLWYPWYTIFISGVYETQYLYLVTTIQNIYFYHLWYTLFMSIVYMIHNNYYAYYPRYTPFMSGIHDTQYLWLVSMVQKMYVCMITMICNIYIMQPYDAQYLCLVSMIHIIYYTIDAQYLNELPPYLRTIISFNKFSFESFKLIDLCRCVSFRISDISILIMTH